MIFYLWIIHWLVSNEYPISVIGGVRIASGMTWELLMVSPKVNCSGLPYRCRGCTEAPKA